MSLKQTMILFGLVIVFKMSGVMFILQASTVQSFTTFFGAITFTIKVKISGKCFILIYFSFLKVNTVRLGYLLLSIDSQKIEAACVF